MKRSVLRILYVTGSLYRGGAETQMALLIEAMIERGCSCELFVLQNDGPFRRVLEDKGVVIHDGGYNPSAPRWRKLVMLAAAFVRLWAIAVRTKPDVVHAYLPLTNFIGALAGRLAGADRVITSKRALGKHQDRHPYWRPFDRVANALSHCITVNAQAVGQDTIRRDKVAPSKLVHIPNGLDFTRFALPSNAREAGRRSLGLAEHETAVLSVGNLIPYKGHADLLRAIPLIRTDNLRFFVAGEDRGIEKDLRALVRELGIGERVTFMGGRSDVPALMCAMDLFVLPSHEEGLSNALLEALAAGMPVVATDVGGNREVLEDGRFGILVAPHDPAALASAIRTLVHDASKRDSIRITAPAHVRQKYSVERMLDAHMSLYRSEHAGRCPEGA